MLGDVNLQSIHLRVVEPIASLKVYEFGGIEARRASRYRHGNRVVLHRPNYKTSTELAKNHHMVMHIKTVKFKPLFGKLNKMDDLFIVMT